jgi:CDP-2,3-bis-(O-geranylgeranyl)-sn-glycerol synthase
MLELILKSLYFFLPAYLANMSPVLFRWLPFFDKPLHSGWFGAHKTWRGLFLGAVVGILVFLLQQYAYVQGFTGLALIDYGGFSWVFGGVLGLGALLGDLTESFFKRRKGIAAGKSWIPWDQLDFVLGGIIFGGIFYVPAAEVMLLLILISPPLHFAVNYLGYLMGIRKSKW